MKKLSVLFLRADVEDMASQTAEKIIEVLNAVAAKIISEKDYHTELEIGENDFALIICLCACSCTYFKCFNCICDL